MLIAFEVYLVPGTDASTLLSPDLLKETGAKVMTIDEARKVGFDGLKPQPGEVRLIAANARDKQWILRALEAHAGVMRFDVHEVDG